jgi:glycosyltransferase involved in cell wall biosynthesis
MPEVCGDAVYYFDPYDVENMADVMMTALTDPVGRSEKKELMAKQIDGFSWEKNAKQTIDLYKKVYGETA